MEAAPGPDWYRGRRQCRYRWDPEFGKTGGRLAGIDDTIVMKNYSLSREAGTTIQGYFKKEKSQIESDKGKSEVIVCQRVRNNW
jgi:hypothetical protein